MISLSKFFASGGEITEWKMGIIHDNRARLIISYVCMYRIYFFKRHPRLSAALAKACTTLIHNNAALIKVRGETELFYKLS
jgi:hypothetical protein